jgi:hypothetical protein
MCFVYTPKHSSWLNQIEVTSGVITRRVNRPGSFTSKQDLKDKILSFIGYYHPALAKSLNWIYSGRPAASSQDRRPKPGEKRRRIKKTDQLLALVAS